MGLSSQYRTIEREVIYLVGPEKLEISSPFWNVLPSQEQKIGS